MDRQVKANRLKKRHLFQQKNQTSPPLFQWSQ